RARSCIHESRSHSGVFENCNHTIDCVALPNRPQIEFHSGSGKAHGTRYGIKKDVLPADADSSFCQFCSGWIMSTPAEESPGSHQWSNCDVKGAIRLLAIFQGSKYKLKNFWISRYCFLSCQPVDARKFARASVIAQSLFQSLYFIECRFKVRICLLLIQ